MLNDLTELRTKHKKSDETLVAIGNICICMRQRAHTLYLTASKQKYQINRLGQLRQTIARMAKPQGKTFTHANLNNVGG